LFAKSAVVYPLLFNWVLFDGIRLIAMTFVFAVVFVIRSIWAFNMMNKEWWCRVGYDRWMSLLKESILKNG
jgi:hypothetical protein